MGEAAHRHALKRPANYLKLLGWRLCGAQVFYFGVFAFFAVKFFSANSWKFASFAPKRFYEIGSGARLSRFPRKTLMFFVKAPSSGFLHQRNQLNISTLLSNS